MTHSESQLGISLGCRAVPPGSRHAPGDAGRVDQRPEGETCGGEGSDAGQGPQRKGRPGCVAGHALPCPGLWPRLRRWAGLGRREGPAPPLKQEEQDKPGPPHSPAPKVLKRVVQLVPTHLWTLALAGPGHTEAQSQEPAPAQSLRKSRVTNACPDLRPPAAPSTCPSRCCPQAPSCSPRLCPWRLPCGGALHGSPCSPSLSS